MSGETRKLQKVGGGTYTVSIPKEWATEQSLSAGDLVHLYPDGDGSLVVCRDESATEPRRTTVSLRETAGADAAFERVLSAAYAAGLERLTLSIDGGFDAEQRRRIERLVREGTGMRVAEVTDQVVEVRIILDDDQVAVERTVVQLQFVALSLYRTAIGGALDATTIGDERVAARRDDAGRLLSLVTRQFDRSLSRPATAGDLGVDRAEAFALYRTANALEGVARAAADLAAAVAASDESPPATAECRSVADATRLFVEDATSAVVDGAGVEAVQECYRTADEITAAVADLDRPVGDATDGCSHGHALVDALRESARYGEAITDVAYQNALRRNRSDAE